MSARGKATLLLTFVFALALGCASLLGVEEATCDPTLDPRCDPDFVPDSGDRSDAASASDAGREDPHLELCGEYCDTIADACRGNDEQYMSRAACLQVCGELMISQAKLDPEAELTNNSVECRLNAARAAADFGEVARNCQAASMFGNAECGEPCEVYCSMLETACPDQYEDLGDCEIVCQDVPLSDVPFGTNVADGNTLQCRVYHIQLATNQQRPDIHCPHAVGQDDTCQ